MAWFQRARDSRALEIRVHNLRDWTTTGIRPWTTGRSAAAKAWCSSRSRCSSGGIDLAGAERRPAQSRAAFGAGRRVRPGDGARDLSDAEELLLICGRYEGVDERVAEHLADEELSIGNYVLSGGELAAAVVVERWRACCRACWATRIRP